MLTELDTIVVHISGSNGRSAANKVVAQRFNGFGNPIDDRGRETGGARLNIPETLRGVAGAAGRGQGAGAPEYPLEEYLRLNRAGDAAGVQRLNLDFARRVAASQANGVGDPRRVIAEAVIEFCRQNYGATDNDRGARGDQLVIKPENIDVSVFRAPNEGPMTYTVTGTAVYGG